MADPARNPHNTRGAVKKRKRTEVSDGEIETSAASSPAPIPGPDLELDQITPTLSALDNTVAQTANSQPDIAENLAAVTEQVADSEEQEKVCLVQ